MNQQSKVIVVFGKRGSGKSTLAKKLVADRKRLVIYDSLGEYTDGVIFYDFESLLTFFDKTKSKNFRVIYQPKNPLEEFASICLLVVSLEDVCFLVEEVDLYATPTKIDSEFANVIQRGRHFDIDIIGISQRPASVSRLITSQAKDIYTFKMTEPRDIDYLCFTCGADFKVVKDLKPYFYLAYIDGKIVSKENKFLP